MELDAATGDGVAASVAASSTAAAALYNPISRAPSVQCDQHGALNLSSIPFNDRTLAQLTEYLALRGYRYAEEALTGKSDGHLGPI